MNEKLKIGVIGDFDEAKPAHRATNEAILHCAAHLSLNVEISWLPTESLENNIDKDNFDYDALWCSPGSPYLSFKGAINAIRFARENNYPFLGTCGGFQHAVIEYAQNVLKIADASHAEYDPDASILFISALSCPLLEETKKIYLKKGSMIQKIYEIDEIEEKYNCSFGLNVSYQNTFEESGFKATGIDANGEVRIFELPQNDFYVATLFQPQLSSTPSNPHKLILQYLLEAEKFHNSKK